MEATALKCQFCGATTTKNGQAFKNKSALNTHINVHCEKKQNNNSEAAAGENEWVLLNPRIHEHARALAAGFTRICEKTGDLD